MVDAVGAAPYAHVDIDDLGADVVAVSAPSWGGPQVGALVFRDPTLLDRIPAVSLNPYARGAERLEVGGHQFALLAGLTSSIDFLAGLDETGNGHPAGAPRDLDQLAAGLPGRSVRIT